MVNRNSKLNSCALDTMYRLGGFPEAVESLQDLASEPSPRDPPPGKSYHTTVNLYQDDLGSVSPRNKTVGVE